jgi:hypothetical protein
MVVRGFIHVDSCPHLWNWINSCVKNDHCFTILGTGKVAEKANKYSPFKFINKGYFKMNFINYSKYKTWQKDWKMPYENREIEFAIKQCIGFEYFITKQFSKEVLEGFGDENG